MEAAIESCNFNIVNRDVMNFGCYVIDFIKYFNSLNRLDLKQKSISNTQFLKLLQNNFTIEELDLSFNCILYLNYFEDLLLKNSFLHTIILSHNQISDIQCFDIILLANHTLQYLDLSYNKIIDTTPLNSIQENNTLKTLILSHNNIVKINFDLTHNTTLTHLDLSYNYLSNIDFIGDNQSLLYLDLSNNKNIIDFKPLIPLLSENIIQYLNISHTGIKNINIFEILQINSSLIDLNLCGRYFKDLNPLNSLVYNTSLTTLNLSKNILYYHQFNLKILENILS